MPEKYWKIWGDFETKKKARLSLQCSEEPRDEKLVEKAMKVLSQGYPTASLSLFKRELLIGHKAATRLMISLEERGVIEPDDSRLSKKVLINNPSPIFCVACKSTKINKSEVICASCQEWVKEVQKSLGLVKS